MLRIKTSALDVRNGKFFYKGHVFTGIGFEISGELVERVAEYQNGEIVGEYTNDLTSSKEKIIFLDDDCLDPDYGDQIAPYMFNDIPFSGVSYEFDGDFCIAERVCQNGRICCETSWYSTGELASFEDWRDENFSQDIWWYKNGGYQHIELVEKDTFRFSVKFDEEHMITSISIDGNYFSRITNWQGILKVRFLNSKIDIKDCEIASSIHLLGSEIDDEFFGYLQLSNGFRQVVKIRFYNTGLSNEGFLTLIGWEGIREILMVDDNYNTLVTAQSLKKAKPSCYVEFNGEEVRS